MDKISMPIKLIRALTGVVVAMLCSFHVCAETGKSGDVSITMYKGESVVLQVGEIDRVVVGSGAVISTRVLGTGDLVIVADEVGMTNIHIWTKDNDQLERTIFVLPASSNRTVGEVTELLRNVEGIKVKSVAGRPVIEGDIYERDKTIVERVQGLYPDLINLTRVSNAFSEKMVYMNVQITEFSTGDLETLGIKWDKSIAGPSGAYYKGWDNNNLYRPDSLMAANASTDYQTIPKGADGGYAFFGIATEIGSRINYLVQTNEAYLLATPRLSARSGGQAEFLAGGQVPVVTSNINGSSVSYKDFGIKLKIEPFADTHGNISAKVSTEVSIIDLATSVDGNPGFKTRSTSTDVNMRDGETLVISGLSNSEDGRTIDKIKWLGDLPVIGHFFRNRDFTSKKTELVIFVTPSIIDVNHDINHAEADKRDKLINRFNSSFEKGLFE